MHELRCDAPVVATKRVNLAFTEVAKFVSAIVMLYCDSPRWRVWSLAFCFLLCLAAHAKETQWLRVTTPEFTVITSLPEKDAIAWTGEFSQFVAALQGFIRVDPKRLPRLTLIVFARDREFANFRPLAANGKPEDVAGFFAHRDSWAVAGVGSEGWGGETKSTIFHEGTHWFLSAHELPNPVWLEEGLAEVFSTFQINKKTISWGRAIDEHVEVLNQQPLLSMEQLLFVNRDSLFVGGDEASERTGMIYAQSWAFVHYLMFGQNDAPQGAMMAYVRALRTAVHPDDAFKQAFSEDYRAMEDKLRRYLHSGRYRVAQPPLAVLAPVHAERATTVEVEEALARLCLVGRRHAEAIQHANKALAAAGDSPVPYELLGLVHKERGDKAAALEAFEQAVHRKSQDFAPYYELGRAQQDAAVQLDGSLGNFSAEDARKVANRYERAINLNPRYRPAYEALAGVVELAPAGNAQDALFLQLGAKLFPDDAMIRLGLAVLEKRDGDSAKATELLAAVLDGEPPAHVRAYARRLELAWLRQDVFNQTEALMKEKKYDEALALLDRRAGESNNPGFVQQLRATRRSIQDTQRYEAIRSAMGNGAWPEARRLMNEILESEEAGAMLKNQIRRMLGDLDRRGLGKPKE